MFGFTMQLPGAFRTGPRRWSSVERPALCALAAGCGWSATRRPGFDTDRASCRGSGARNGRCRRRGEDAVVVGEPGALAGHERHAALADDDRPGGHELAVAGLHAEALADAVAAVLGARACLLVGHCPSLPSWGGRVASWPWPLDRRRRQVRRTCGALGAALGAAFAGAVCLGGSFRLGGGLRSGLRRRLGGGLALWGGLVGCGLAGLRASRPERHPRRPVGRPPLETLARAASAAVSASLAVLRGALGRPGGRP